MAIASIGVGSGLALDDLVTQLLQAERKPRQDRFDQREEQLEAVISGIGQLQSKMSDFKDSVNELRSAYELNGRKALITHPDTDEGDSGNFTAEASNSATAATYEIAVAQLASGSRYETVDGDFASTSDSVSAAGGTLTFAIAGGDSFDINVSAGMTLSQLRTAINNASDNFGVTANIINTGATGPKLVYTSDVTGDGNDLSVTGGTDMQKVTTDGTLEQKKSAQNAQALIDGILVESETNEFENVIENVSFEVSKVSTLLSGTLADAPEDRTYDVSTMEIGYDREGVKNKITDFVDNYNSLIKEISTLTKYGLSELEDDGPLAGDFMARGIASGLSNIISSSVEGSSLGSLFQIGIAFNDDGELEISDVDEYGFGSGQELLDEALDENYDEIAKLFSDDDNGIANRLYDFAYEYTTFGGLLRSRESSYKDEKDTLSKERERFELQMLNYEQLLRDKYINLDLTVSKLNQTGTAMMASLGSIAQ